MCLRLHQFPKLIMICVYTLLLSMEGLKSGVAIKGQNSPVYMTPVKVRDHLSQCF